MCLPISIIGNQVSRDNLETVGPIWMIPTSAPLKFKFQSRYGQIDPPRQACVHARNFFVSRIAHFGQFWPKCASVFLWKIFPLMGNSCNLQELKKNQQGHIWTKTSPDISSITTIFWAIPFPKIGYPIKICTLLKGHIKLLKSWDLEKILHCPLKILKF